MLEEVSNAEVMKAFDESMGDPVDSEEQQPGAADDVGSSAQATNPEGQEEEVGAEGDDVSEVEALRQQLKDMSVMISQLVAKQGEATGAPKQVEHKPIEFFKNEDDFNETFATPESANAFANNVVKQALALAREQLMQELPDVVKPLINDRARKQSIVAHFFDSNRDLRDMQEFVQTVAVKIGTEKPDITYEQLFLPAAEGKPSLLEATVRKMLKRPRDKAAENVANSNPAFAGKSGGRLPQKTEDDFMAQVMKDIIGE